MDGLSSAKKGLSSELETSPESIDVQSQQGTTNCTNTNLGYAHWLEQRKSWTAGHVSYSPERDPLSYRRNSNYSLVGPEHYERLYTCLIDKGRRLAKPAPLDLVVDVIVDGWKRRDLWPPPNSPQP